VLYRLYKPEDFAQLYAIEEVCFQPPFRFGRRYMRQLVGNSNSATWIAEEGERMCGFAIVEWTHDPVGVIAYIQTLEVTPDWRGQGVGGELLRCIEGSARDAGAQAIRLHVDAENGEAVRLYEARGYLCEGREEDYYAPGRGALIFEKSLGEGRGEKS
jgi:ribosomal protein S18 acetylase RimI-like enzyme